MHAMQYSKPETYNAVQDLSRHMHEATKENSSEVENKMILMGHQISSCHALVVGSFKGNSKVI